MKRREECVWCTYGLLDLAFVGLDLVLQFVDHVLHAFLGLAVLVSLEGQLLETAVLLAHTLGGLGVAALLVVELHLQLAHSLFQLLDHALASLEGGGLGLVQTYLQLLNLALQGAAHLLDVAGVLLFLAQLLGQPGGVGHGLLGVLLSSLQLVGLVVQVGLHGLDVSLQLPLGGGQRRVAGGQLRHAVARLVQLALGGFACALGSLQLGAQLLDLTGQDVGAALGLLVLFAGLVTGTLLVLDGRLHLTQLLLVLLDVLLGLGAATVGTVQGHLQLVDVLLQLLLHAHGLSLAAGLSLQGSLHAVKGTLVVLAARGRAKEKCRISNHPHV